MVITNNPLVRSRLDDTHEVIYLELSYEELLKVVRDRIYEGHRLLTHPLSGSVKPKETPYKSVLISERKEKVDGDISYTIHLWKGIVLGVSQMEKI